MRKSTLFLLLLSLSLPCLGQSGPFGFEKGMTKAQIISLVGQKAVDKRNSAGDRLVVMTAPKANAAFATYMLLVSPTEGLLRVVALGRPIMAGDDGAELKSAYQDLLKSLTDQYGAPASTIDTCRGPKALCGRSDNWMMALMGKQRTLASAWTAEVPTKAMRDSGVHAIAIQAQAPSLTNGFVSCDFELEGFQQYAEKMKAQGK